MTGDRVPQWRSMTDGERQQQYSPSSSVGGDISEFLDAYNRRSRAARDQVASDHPLTTVAYGSKPANTVDVVVPAATTEPPPLHVFIHGGYWQQLSKNDSFFLAVEAVNRGHAFAAVDYTLAPEAELDEIVAECTTALEVLQDQAANLGINQQAITVSGSSAGAHLTAMTAVKLPPGRRPAALILVSGIFELEPLIGTTINDAVGLDIAAARRNSPLLADLADLPPTVVAHGDNEPDEFKRQSRAMTDALRRSGTPVAEREVAGRNHFDVVFDIISLLESQELESLVGGLGRSAPNGTLSQRNTLPTEH